MTAGALTKTQIGDCATGHIANRTALAVASGDRPFGTPIHEVCGDLLNHCVKMSLVPAITSTTASNLLINL